MLYEPSIDIVNSNVYTKFGLMLFIHSQDIEQKPYSDINVYIKCCLWEMLFFEVYLLGTYLQSHFNNM